MRKPQKKEEITENAVKVSKLYYYHNMTTDEISSELHFSRAKVSRLLNFARHEGLIDIRINDERFLTKPLANSLKGKYRRLNSLHIVSVSNEMGEGVVRQRVAQYASNYINYLLKPGTICGIAWSPMIEEISRFLIPKTVRNLLFVQINGLGDIVYQSNQYMVQCFQSFSRNYQAQLTLFPVPIFFDNPSTKEALWKEKSIRKILELQQKSNTLIFSINSNLAIMNNEVYPGGSINSEQIKMIVEERIIGEVATTFFSDDYENSNLLLNTYSSGPGLEIFKQAPHSLCVISGANNAQALDTALKSGYINDLIVDESTAQILLDV